MAGSAMGGGATQATGGGYGGAGGTGGSGSGGTGAGSGGTGGSGGQQGTAPSSTAPSSSQSTSEAAASTPNSSRVGTLAEALGMVANQSKTDTNGDNGRTAAAIDNANGKNGTFGTPLSGYWGGAEHPAAGLSAQQMRDAERASLDSDIEATTLSIQMAKNGLDLGTRVGLLGTPGLVSSELGESAYNGARFFSNFIPGAGLVNLGVNAADAAVQASNYGLNAVKGQLPGIAGGLVTKVAGPLFGTLASAGTSFAAGDEEAGGGTLGGLAGSMVNGLLDGNALTGMALNKAGKYTGGLLAQSVSNAAPSGDTDGGTGGGNNSAGSQSGRSDFAAGSLSQSLLGNTGSTGNTGRTGLNNAAAPKQVVPPAQIAVANYSQFL